MTTPADAIQAFDAWFGELDPFRHGLPARGAIAAGLIVIDRLRSTFDLSIDAHKTDKQGQVAGVSSSALQSILNRYGETRTLSNEAGRTNRGALGDVDLLLKHLKPLKLERMEAAARDVILDAVQRHAVTVHVSKYFALLRVRAEFRDNKATWHFIRHILEEARHSGKTAAVAEYLVGAKLALKYPDREIRNKPFSAADTQTGWSGDFQVGNTVFHVTLAALPKLFDKCQQNLRDGLRVYILVPRSQVVGASQNAENLLDGDVAVESIESFIATNLDEQAEFDGSKLPGGLRRYLEIYNQRVDGIEHDKSLLIQIPPNL